MELIAARPTVNPDGVVGPVDAGRRWRRCGHRAVAPWPHRRDSARRAPGRAAPAAAPRRARGGDRPDCVRRRQGARRARARPARRPRRRRAHRGHRRHGPCGSWRGRRHARSTSPGHACACSRTPGHRSARSPWGPGATVGPTTNATRRSSTPSASGCRRRCTDCRCSRPCRPSGARSPTSSTPPPTPSARSAPTSGSSPGTRRWPPSPASPAVDAVGQHCCAVFRPVGEDGTPRYGAACPCRTGTALEELVRVAGPDGDRWLNCAVSPTRRGRRRRRRP